MPGLLDREAFSVGGGGFRDSLGFHVQALRVLCFYFGDSFYLDPKEPPFLGLFIMNSLYKSLKGRFLGVKVELVCMQGIMVRYRLHSAAKAEK